MPLSDHPTFRTLTAFFLPLVVIVFSQSFTYPLVASVVSHGPMGGLEYEAYVIGQQVLTFLASTSFGLVTTGIVFGTTRLGCRNFLWLSLLLAAVAALCQTIAALPATERLVFGRILAVDNPVVRTVARRSVIACIPMQMNFYVRTLFLTPLLRAKRSDLANAATLIRVAVAVPLAWCFVRFGLVGHIWGAVAMTLPCLVETGLTWHFSRPFAAALPEPAPDAAPPASVNRQLRFAIPLSAGAFLLTATSAIATYFYSRSSDPERYRLVHYVAYGLAISFLASAQQIQTVAVVFAKTVESARRVVSFALASGAGLGAALLAASFCAPFSRWYFCDFQKIPPGSLGLATAALAAGSGICVLNALRGFVEGLAAVRLKPRAVLLGQAVYVAVFWRTFDACPALLAGRDHLWGMAAIAVATAFSASVTYVSSFVIPASVNSAGRNRGGNSGKP